MKHISTFFIAAAMTAAVASAQQPSTKLVVTMKDGATTEYNVAEIDNISFLKSEDPKPVTGAAYSFTVPSDFGTCTVHKVMADGKQIAEIDYEYIKSVTSRRVVA